MSRTPMPLPRPASVPVQVPVPVPVPRPVAGRAQVPVPAPAAVPVLLQQDTALSCHGSEAEAPLPSRRVPNPGTTSQRGLPGKGWKGPQPLAQSEAQWKEAQATGDLEGERGVGAIERPKGGKGERGERGCPGEGALLPLLLLPVRCTSPRYGRCATLQLAQGGYFHCRRVAA